jgi:hypothetical protein
MLSRCGTRNLPKKMRSRYAPPNRVPQRSTASPVASSSQGERSTPAWRSAKARPAKDVVEAAGHDDGHLVPAAVQLVGDRDERKTSPR